MELPKEQFDYQKTLADIGVQIAKGRAELSELEKTKQDYLLAREKEAEGHIQAVLKASQEALNQIGTNQDALTIYARQLENFADELAKWNEKLAKQQQDFEAKNSTIMAKISQKTVNIERATIELKMQQAVIESDRRENIKRHQQLNTRERAINDKYKTLLSTERSLKQ